MAKKKTKSEETLEGWDDEGDLPPDHLVEQFDRIKSRLNAEIGLTSTPGWESRIEWIENQRKDHALQSIDPNLTTKMPDLIMHQMYIKAFDDIVNLSRSVVIEYNQFKLDIEDRLPLFSKFFKFVSVEWDPEIKRVIEK